MPVLALFQKLFSVLLTFSSPRYCTINAADIMTLLESGKAWRVMCHVINNAHPSSRDTVSSHTRHYAHPDEWFNAIVDRILQVERAVPVTSAAALTTRTQSIGAATGDFSGSTATS
jgi:hypothetical protein